MDKLKKLLASLAHGLKVQNGLRIIQRRRMAARHKGQKKAERQAETARDAAERALANGNKARAQRKTSKALKLDGKADRERARAVAHRGRVRVLTQRIEKLETDEAAAEKAMAKWKAEHGPHVGRDGKVAGADSKGEAAIYAAKYVWQRCASNTRPNYYSMTGGGFNVTHPLLKGGQKSIGQVPYERSDCSVFVTEVCWAAGLPDPNGADYKGGYTGTLVGQHNGWKEVSEARMREVGWGFTIYGSGAGHHTEFYVGEGGTMTIGHGSAPVDPGVINLFGDGSQRCFIYDPD